jgi:hypothetical protein
MHDYGIKLKLRFHSEHIGELPAWAGDFAQYPARRVWENRRLRHLFPKSEVIAVRWLNYGSASK